MARRRDWAKRGLHRPHPDEDKPARKHVLKRGRKPGHKSGRSERARFLSNDRRRVRRALEPDYRDGERARRYGLTLADYRALQAQQGNACAICRKVTRALCIDHCHVTGRVRGLLCRSCNSALGFYADDPRLLRAALAYLQAATNR
jgi:Recombination endonuclease VII